MRQFMNGVWSGQPNGVEILQPVFRRISIALAIAGILCLSVALSAFGFDSPVIVHGQ